MNSKNNSQPSSLTGVAVTIVNWNGKELTLRLLKSLEAVTSPSLKIIVVDNASTDGSVETIRENYPSVEIIEMARNVGYSAGINAGLKHLLKSGAEFYWVFNNDVEVEPDTLDHLLDQMESDPKTGVAGPLVLDHATGEIAHTGYRIDMWTGRMKELGLPADETPYEVDSAFGCSNLIRAETLEQTGLFNPDYNVYFDETDFNTRARRKGWKVVVVPKAKVRHEESATMNRRMIHKAWLLLRNLLLFEINNASPMQFAVFLPYYFSIHVPYFLIRGTFYAIKFKLSGGKSS